MFGKKQQDKCKSMASATNKGMVMIRLNDGSHSKVTKAEFDTGNFISVNEGFAIYVDSHGNKIRCKLDDHRVLSGELVHMNTGRHKTAAEKQRISAHVSTLKWYTNGIKSVRTLEQPGVDWVPGRSKRI